MIIDDQEIHIDRDTSQPEARMKKRKKKPSNIEEEKSKKTKDDERKEAIKEKKSPPQNNRNSLEEKNSKAQEDKGISVQNSLANEKEGEKLSKKNSKVSKQNSKEEKVANENNKSNKENDKTTDVMKRESSYLEQNTSLQKDKNNDASDPKKSKNEKPSQGETPNETMEVEKLIRDLKPVMVDEEVQNDEFYSSLLNSYELKIKEMTKNYEDKISSMERASIENEKMNSELIQKLKGELTSKNKNISILTKTNEKLKKNLIELSTQVNNLYLTINEPKKPKKEPSHPDPDQREKELKNAMVLIKILSNDNKKLHDTLDNYGEYNKKVELQDIATNKDKTIEKLEDEIKILTGKLERHKKCDGIISSLRNIILSLKDELQRAKEKNSSLLSKMQAAERNEIKIRTKLANSVAVLPKKLNQSASTGDLMMAEAQKKKSLPSLTLTKYLVNVLTEEEKSKLAKLYKGETEKYNQLIKKISILEAYRNSTDALIRSGNKRLQDAVDTQVEQIEYLQLKNKEIEMKLKISAAQISDFKASVRAYQKKISSQQRLIDTLLIKTKSGPDLCKNYLSKTPNKKPPFVGSLNLDKIINRDKSEIDYGKSRALKEVDVLSYNEIPLTYSFSRLEESEVAKEEEGKERDEKENHYGKSPVNHDDIVIISNDSSEVRSKKIKIQQEKK